MLSLCSRNHCHSFGANRHVKLLESFSQLERLVDVYKSEWTALDHSNNMTHSFDWYGVLLHSPYLCTVHVMVLMVDKGEEFCQSKWRQMSLNIIMCDA